MSQTNINPKGAFANQRMDAWLKKFEIDALNPMQLEAGEAIRSKSDVVLLSPTGSGKTLAFLLPLIEKLDEQCAEIQALILVPSRELAQQIEQVARKMGTGFKVNAVYGGRAGQQDRLDLKQLPAILIGTPGRWQIVFGGMVSLWIKSIPLCWMNLISLWKSDLKKK